MNRSRGIGNGRNESVGSHRTITRREGSDCTTTAGPMERMTGAEIRARVPRTLTRNQSVNDMPTASVRIGGIFSLFLDFRSSIMCRLVGLCNELVGTCNRDGVPASCSLQLLAAQRSAAAKGRVTNAFFSGSFFHFLLRMAISFTGIYDCKVKWPERLRSLYFLLGPTNTFVSEVLSLPHERRSRVHLAVARFCTTRASFH